MENQVMGKRTELDKFLAFANKHADGFASTEYFTVHNGQLRRTLDPKEASYEVGTVNRAALMKAYVLHVWTERQATVSETGIFQIPVITDVVN